MGNRLVITVEVGGEKKLSMYWHWGADCASEFYEKCKLLSLLDPTDDLETMLRKICDDNENAGLATDVSWWTEHWGDEQPVAEYAEERKAVQAMLEKGIRPGTDRSTGMIAITPKAIELMENIAEWSSILDLSDPAPFTFVDCLWLEEDPDEYAEAEEEGEILEMPEWMKMKVTKDNAHALAQKIFSTVEAYYRDPETNNVYQFC